MVPSYHNHCFIIDGLLILVNLLLKVCHIWGRMRPPLKVGGLDGQRCQTLELAHGSGWCKRLLQTKVLFQSLRYVASLMPFLFPNQLILILIAFEDYTWSYSPWTTYQYTHDVCWDRYTFISILSSLHFLCILLDKLIQAIFYRLAQPKDRWFVI